MTLGPMEAIYSKPILNESQENKVNELEHMIDTFLSTNYNGNGRVFVPFPDNVESIVIKTLIKKYELFWDKAFLYDPVRGFPSFVLEYGGLNDE